MASPLPVAAGGKARAHELQLERFVKQAHRPLNERGGREERGGTVVVDLQAEAFAAAAYDHTHLGAGVQDPVAHEL